MSMTIRHRRLSAFTILEILIAIGILAVGISAAISLFTTGVRQYKDAIDATQVSLLAEATLVEAQKELNENDTPPTPLWKRDTNFPTFEYRIEYTATDLAGEYKVRVIIGWAKEKKPPHPDDDRFELQKEFHTVLLKE